MPPNSTTNPIDVAHNAIRNPSSTVQSILSSLTEPPLQSIPNISSSSARVGQWARFTGLVQDVWDTELFMASCPSGHSALLTEHADVAVSATDDNVRLAERLPVYLVSVPGQSNWTRPDQVSSIDRSSSPPPSVNGNGSGSGEGRTKLKMKRTRDDVEMEDMAIASAEATGSSNSDSLPLQAVVPPSASANASIPTPSAARPPLPKHSASDKRSKPSTPLHNNVSNAQSHLTAATTLGLNTPDSGTSCHSTAVVAKLYTPATNSNATDSADTTPKLNTVIEAIGILQDGYESTSEMEEFQAELLARNPKNVRRLHVVKWRIVPFHESNPLISQQLTTLDLPTVRQQAITVLQNGMRDSIIAMLASCVLNDKLAAEYILMCIMSKPVRVSGQVLGKISLNIVYPCTDNTCDIVELVKLLKMICSRVVVIDVNIGSMNCMDVYAKKDYEINRLKAGRLQVAEGTVLVMNESELSDGRLSERGVKNIRALKSVSDNSTAPVDFKYYQSNVDVDASVLQISKNGKSIIGSDVTIRIQKQPEQIPIVKWTDDEVNKVRCAVTLLANGGAGTFDIGDQAGEEVAKVYVQERKEGKAKDGQECLQRWLSVSRCCALSFGENVLSMERWKYALDLEKKRDARVNGGR